MLINQENKNNNILLDACIDNPEKVEQRSIVRHNHLVNIRDSPLDYIKYLENEYNRLAISMVKGVMKSQNMLEDLCSNGDKWGVYQTISTESFVKLWIDLLSNPLLKGKDNLKVADIGSGMNTFCTIGSLLTDRIGEAVGLEASNHRCYLAATGALKLVTSPHLKSLVGFMKQDFESPTLSVRDADLLFFWDRAYNTEMCESFYKIMHNTIDDSVLFVQSGYRLTERLPLLEHLFDVQHIRLFQLTMKGSQSIDTVHLFRLTKRTDVSSELPSSTDPSIFELARDKFSKQNREKTYIKIIDECEESWALPSRKKRKAS